MRLHRANLAGRFLLTHKSLFSIISFVRSPLIHHGGWDALDDQLAGENI
jgi:hypothetical protein